MTKGVYDYLVENNDRLFKANHGIIQKEEIFETPNGAVHKVYHQFLEEELELEQKRIKLEKQADLNKKLIAKWHSQKDKDISENPDQFID